VGVTGTVEHGLGEVEEVLMVSPSHIELACRELGIVGGVNPLITEAFPCAKAESQQPLDTSHDRAGNGQRFIVKKPRYEYRSRRHAPSRQSPAA